MITSVINQFDKKIFCTSRHYHDDGDDYYDDEDAAYKLFNFTIIITEMFTEFVDIIIVLLFFIAHDASWMHDDEDYKNNPSNTIRIIIIIIPFNKNNDSICDETVVVE